MASDTKFGRNYYLSVEGVDRETIIIQPPFTIEFDITRNILSSQNTSSIRIYNLSENNRNKIRKDGWAYDDLRIVALKAGYGTNLPVIFAGNISHAFSVRESVNFITQLECFDGGFAFSNGVTNDNFPPGTSQQTVIDTLVNSLTPYGVQPGSVGSYPGENQGGTSYSGGTTDILSEITGGGFFIDNGKVHCLGDNEALNGEIQVIDSASGLLGTPVRENTYLNFDILFEPRLIIGQQIKLNSVTGANFNSFYKVVSLHHRGTISEAICGDAVTSVGVFAPITDLRLVNGRSN